MKKLTFENGLELNLPVGDAIGNSFEHLYPKSKVKIFPEYQPGIDFLYQGEDQSIIFKPKNIKDLHFAKIKYELDEFLKNSPGVFKKTDTPQQFLDRCLLEIPDKAENFKAVLPTVWEPSFQGMTQYKGFNLEFSEKLKSDQYFVTLKHNEKNE